MMQEMLWLIPLLLGSVYAEKFCKPDHFYNTTSEQCQKCSKCLSGEPLRRRCSIINDTLCGLINFSFSESEPEYVAKKTKEVVPAVLAEDDEKYWKTLAFALIGLLSFLVILASMIVFVMCYKFRHTGWFCKHVTPEPEDMENGYVVIHKFIPDSSAMTLSSCNYSNLTSAASASNESQSFISQQRRKHFNKPYRPKRRLMNECIDEVFESDDSAGSRSLRSQLETIQEASESS